MIRLHREVEVFLKCPRAMQVLIVSNMIYALVLPVIEIFIAAYVMRNSRSVDKVAAYQLSIYVSTPLAFYLNGVLLSRAGAKHLYAAGMLLSGVTIMLLTRLSVLTLSGIAISGLMMGLSTGLFWANRGFLALNATKNSNRNYYYGVELFFGTLTSVVVPALIGWFISGTAYYGWFEGVPDRAYQIVAVVVFGLTVVSAAVLEQGEFRKPEQTRFAYLRFHPLWWRFMQLAFFKGLSGLYFLTAPAMLIMLLVGQEGTLGAVQAIGGVFSACLLYGVGRVTLPRHRESVLVTSLVLFLVGAIINAAFFNTAGVLIFLGCLLLAKPLLDLAYNPIELQVVDVLSRIEGRNAYAYLFNHEFGLFAGRLAGCIVFLAIFHWGSTVAALKYALPVIALLQLFSIRSAGQVSRGVKDLEG